MKALFFASVVLLFPLASHAASNSGRFAALAAGTATNDYAASVASGFGLGQTEEEAEQRALSRCAANYTQIPVTCRIVGSWTRGCGYVSVSRGRLPDGSAIVAYSTERSETLSRMEASLKISRAGGIVDEVKPAVGGCFVESVPDETDPDLEEGD